MDEESSKTGWTDGCLLKCMFTLVLLCSIVVLINAFFRAAATNTQVITLLQQGVEAWPKSPLGKDGSIGPIAKSYLVQLKACAKGSLDSNTISFLFQVFSVSLLSAGVYLLDRSEKNLKRTQSLVERIRKRAGEADELAESAEKKAQSAETVAGRADEIVTLAEDARQAVSTLKIGIIIPLAESYASSNAISAYLSDALQTSWLIRTEANMDLMDANIPKLRDAIRFASRAITDAKNNETGIASLQTNQFYDWLDTIAINLLSQSKETQAKTKDIYELSIACRELLRSTDFGSWHDRLIESLQDNSRM